MFDQTKLQTWNNPANINQAYTPHDAYSPPSWTPGYPTMTAPVYSIEGDSHFRLWFLLPPLDQATMSLSAQGSIVSISAHQIAPELTTDESIVFGQPPATKSWWTLRLPFEVTNGQVEAVYHNGFLELKVSKTSSTAEIVPIPLKAA